MMLLPRTDTALEDCRRHLEACPDIDPAVLSYLVRHLAVTLCAEMEHSLSKILVQRVEAGCDEGPANLIKSVRKNLLRSARPSEIKDIVRYFGESSLARYEDEIRTSVGDEGLSRLGTLVSHRDATAHTEPLDMTFREFELAYQAAVGIATAFLAALPSPNS